MSIPTIFISYSWDSKEHEEWVAALTNELRRNGIDANIDKFITQTNTVNLNRMMIEKIRDSDYTIIVLTDRYAEKSNQFKGGVGYETTLLINFINDSPEKIIPIIRYNGDKIDAVPFYLKGVGYIDFSDNNSFDDKFSELLYRILKVDRIKLEPLGEIPNLAPRKVTKDTLIIGEQDDELIPDFREVTDFDISNFINNGYSEIVGQIKNFADQTKQKNSNFVCKIEDVTSKKTIMRFYLNGMEKHTIKIWVGNNFSRNESILIAYGRHLSMSDNSMNEIISCEIDDKKNITLKPTMSFNNQYKNNDTSGIAIGIWKNILQYLE